MMNKSLFIFLSLITIVSANRAQTFETFEEIHLPTGRHVVADLRDCQQCHYTDEIENVLRKAAEAASATVLDIKIITFPPVLVDGKMVQGMTGMVILSESHIAFHTWPENGFVACDIFTCGTNALPEKGLEIICDYFKPTTMNVIMIGRGLAAE